MATGFHDEPVVTVLTIGHSNHHPETFLGLLEQHGVGCLVDVRSQPFSRRHPHFSRRPLEVLATRAGVKYVFLGDSLGGRPADPDCRLADGRVDYARRARAPDFLAALEQLEQLARDEITAMMCAEEDPARCHRRLLITPALLQRQAAVAHIRGDGRLLPETGGDGDQLSLL